MEFKNGNFLKGEKTDRIIMFIKYENKYNGPDYCTCLLIHDIDRNWKFKENKIFENFTEFKLFNGMEKFKKINI